ncbi:hypothetical protein D0809_02535 [Flavobacterium circumlabens]|uniref:Immunity protein 26 of polymorphic toxin system n=1 Tax=Flavobacterium circumlabens TaxID=2133765 RepID=A0A4Y7UI70_9FLAO|nr:Imm26 family immunity protein [Flavobacterium circumlabens]TCN60759.1 immunity protein 26 of polymorphic toxin system [Flavobacterium circumlabens]TEB45901.1 hypothetical protein D0809_02535 [Flavobacterium circumlabens]
MAEKITVIPVNKKHKEWPKEGDVFYFSLSDGRFGYGMVSLGKIDVGPFKNAILIYIYNNFTPLLDENTSLNKHNLLLPPIITDTSCWKKGYFAKIRNLEKNEMDTYPHHYFKNPIRNKIYDHNGDSITTLIDKIPVGRESIQFHSNIISSIESIIN